MTFLSMDLCVTSFSINLLGKKLKTIYSIRPIHSE